MVVACRGEATTPPETMSFTAFSTDISKGMISSCGTKMIGPVKGDGGLGINQVSNVCCRPVTIAGDSFVTNASE